MRQVAKFMAQFRVMRDDLKRQIQSEMLKIEMEERQKKAAAPVPAPQLPPSPPVETKAPAPLDGNVSAAS